MDMKEGHPAYRSQSDLGVGRVFKIGRQDVSFFVGQFWNVSREVRAPRFALGTAPPSYSWVKQIASPSEPASSVRAHLPHQTKVQCRVRALLLRS